MTVDIETGAEWYLVVDVEATCDDAGSVPREEMEIIEVGAVMVDGETLRPTEEFQAFVRPVRHPTLTEFCRTLTSITQAMVDEASSFPEVMLALGEFIGEREPLFCSWGAYDRNQFRQDARHHGVELPLGRRHVDLKRAFAERIGSRRRLGMAAALRRRGIPLRGTHHRGIDDARNISELLPFCLGRAP